MINPPTTATYLPSPALIFKCATNNVIKYRFY
jgi:hypothetical protein